MKEIKQTSLGFTLPILVYASHEEADKAAGHEGAALDECNKNLVYRGALVDGRAIICEAVEKATGIKRETVPVMKTVKKKDEATGQEVSVKEQSKDKDGNPLFEYKLEDGEYVKLALAKSGKKPEEIQPFVDEAARNFVYTEERDGKEVEVARGLQVDIRVKERKAPGPKVLPEKYKNAAEGAIKTGKVAKFAKDYEKLFGKPLESQEDVTKLGYALKEFFEEQTRRQMANLLGS